MSPGLAQRALRRLLDPSKHIDLVLAALPGLAAMGFAVAVGAWGDVVDVPESALVLHPDLVGQGTYTVYGFGGFTNFHLLTLLLPGVLAVLRWMMQAMAPVVQAWPPERVPPIVRLAEPEGRPEAYAALQRALLNPWILGAAVGLATVFQVLDLASVLSTYWTGQTGGHLGYSHLFLVSSVTKGQNLVLLGLAYLPQYLLVILTALAVVLLVRHNLFFLGRIYRRSTASGSPAARFQIDLDDVDHCFGFRAANEAFNVQVLIWALAAVVLFGTRLSHAIRADIQEPAQLLQLDAWFSDVGQWAVPMNLGLGLAVIFLPALVKILPFVPPVASSEARRDLGSYLREFLAPERWALDHATRDELNDLAARFSSNAFWPTGDNRAGVLFVFGAFVCAFTVGTPLLTYAWDHPQGALLVPALFAAQLGVAVGAQRVLFFALRTLLRFVDPRLVEAPSGGPPTSASPLRRRATSAPGVFLSYRRSDAAAYAGRLHADLERRLGGQIFMDLDDIGSGQDFVHAIEQGLDASFAVVVLVGPTWATVTGSDGSLRLHAPGDFVRKEVASALASSCMVIPVLLGGAPMPSVDQLPPDLHPLCRRNALEITDARWAFDVGRLIDALTQAELEDRARRHAEGP